MKPKLIYNKNFFVILSMDIVLVIASMYAAHLTRYDFRFPSQIWPLLHNIIPYIIVIKITSFFYFDLYRGMWRYTSISDLINIIKASSIGSLGVICFVVYNNRFEGFSRSVFAIDWCFTVLLISGSRLYVRFYFEHINNGDTVCNSLWRAFINFLLKRKHLDDSKRLIIIGAGDCGEKIYREIANNNGIKYRVVGFLDDNPTKVGKKIHGVPVLNYIKNITAATKRVNADEALIAIPSATAQQMRTIVSHCKDSGIKFMTIPSLGELINEKVNMKIVREVAYRDLLRRDVVRLDEISIGAYLKDQRVLVTGAAGSIGSELCRQICRFNPESILLYERAESALYETELELKRVFTSVKIIPLLADIQDTNQLEKIFSSYRPHVVFHAAAYKHVPILELQPWIAVENNILGTLNVVQAAKKNNVDRFVFVSTDKAVRPVSIMGATKRIAEMLIQNQTCGNQNHTRFMIVRFGNVIGSNGSVIPLFKKQIEYGGPVTVTHPEVTRFFMTINEASQLILQAGAMGQGGEIFILDMGKSIKIDDMARDLIRLSGYEPDIDIHIEYIGLRPGEKLYEELITEGEGILPTHHEKIMVLKGTKCNLHMLNGNIEKLSMFAKHQDRNNICIILQKMVPEYKPLFMN
ncbi:MAG: polysaccharide biosynthesis protein [Desulfobacterales bacterium]|nr:polysaccharide biosynthesis protein [Desulfobacterales bacterium]